MSTPVLRLDRDPISPKAMRRVILSQSKRANVGHIGSCLSIVEILSALYGHILRIASPEDPDRDRFILSKGHAGLALYAALALKGWLPEDQLDTFCSDGTFLGVHPEASLPGVDFATGSLGMGLSYGAGAALAARLQGSARQVYCLISDAECNEGSIWEAAMFAAHHRLDNLRVILDRNPQQALGLTRDVIDLANLPERWRAFGWATSEVDGHSMPQLADALSGERAGQPHITLAHT